jgi:uncharacterized FlaG/YvyC family protein
MSSVREGVDNPSQKEKSLLSPENLEAFMAFRSEELEISSKLLWSCHQLTKELRFAAEAFKRQKIGGAESHVRFELDPETGKIVVQVKDETTGDLRLVLSEKEVEKILKDLEETEDNESTLTSFILNRND